MKRGWKALTQRPPPPTTLLSEGEKLGARLIAISNRANYLMLFLVSEVSSYFPQSISHHLVTNAHLFFLSHYYYPFLIFIPVMEPNREAVHIY